MENKPKIIKSIILNVLELMPDNQNTMYITLEDAENGSEILELEITLKYREMNEYETN